MENLFSEDRKRSGTVLVDIEAFSVFNWNTERSVRAMFVKNIRGFESIMVSCQ